MPMTLADAADLTDASIQEIGLAESAKLDTSYSEIYDVMTGVTDLDYKDSSLGGLGYAGRIVEQAAATEKVPPQGNDKTYTQAQYGIIFTVSKLQWFFGIKKRKLEAVTQEALRAVGNLRNRRLYEKLDNAFDTSYTAQDISGNYSITISGGDSVALVSNAHTREDGGTNNNNRVTDGTTVNMDFDYDAIKAAHRTAQLIRDYNGLPMTINLDTLVVSKNTTNYFRALEILGAIKKDRIPGEMSNDGSGAMAFKVHATPWVLTNTGYWFMTDSSLKGSQVWGSLRYLESEPVHIEPVNVVYKTGELQFKAVGMWAWGHNGYRNLVGSKNTNAA